MRITGKLFFLPLLVATIAQGASRFGLQPSEASAAGADDCVVPIAVHGAPAHADLASIAASGVVKIDPVTGAGSLELSNLGHEPAQYLLAATPDSRFGPGEAHGRLEPSESRTISVRADLGGMGTGVVVGTIRVDVFTGDGATPTTQLDIPLVMA
jgi:hypothetical protein